MKRGDVIKNQFIDKEEVRSMCIRNRFYTSGDCEAYANMFKKCNKKPTTAVLADIAKDIWSHSTDEALADLESFVNIMDMLYSRCVVTYFAEVK